MKRTVIYIMGAGRSGTTLLDVVLGNAAGVRSCGELVRFPELHGNPHGAAPDSASYLFWKRVQARLEQRLGGALDFSALEHMVSRVDYHRAFPLNYLNMVPAGIRRWYVEYATALYDAIFDEIAEDTLVDSSKYPSRALALYKFLDYDIRYVYLVRHPEMVVRSFSKSGLEQPPKSFLAANQYYYLVNRACNAAISRMGDAMVACITYEQLTEEPVKSLEKVQNAIQVDMTAAIEKLAHGDELKVNHLFEGNRIRMRESLKLEQGSKVIDDAGMRSRLTGMLNRRWWVRNQ